MPKPSKTDWEKLEVLPDEEIDYSDIPPLTETFFKRAQVRRPQSRVTVTMELDSDILEWFKREDKDWEDRVQAALRIYVEAHKAYRQETALSQ
jgi:uncharacterized protein (DUF4415 family)